MTLDALIREIESRKREEKSIDGLRDEILGFLNAYYAAPAPQVYFRMWVNRLGAN